MVEDGLDVALDGLILLDGEAGEGVEVGTRVVEGRVEGELLALAAVRTLTPDGERVDTFGVLVQVDVVEVLGDDGREIEMRDLDDEVFRAAEELGIDISRPERGTDEDDARRERERAERAARY